LIHLPERGIESTSTPWLSKPGIQSVEYEIRFPFEKTFKNIYINFAHMPSDWSLELLRG